MDNTGNNFLGDLQTLTGLGVSAYNAVNNTNNNGQVSSAVANNTNASANVKNAAASSLAKFAPWAVGLAVLAVGALIVKKLLK